MGKRAVPPPPGQEQQVPGTLNAVSRPLAGDATPSAQATAVVDQEPRTPRVVASTPITRPAATPVAGEQPPKKVKKEAQTPRPRDPATTTLAAGSGSAAVPAPGTPGSLAEPAQKRPRQRDAASAEAAPTPARSLSQASLAPALSAQAPVSKPSRNKKSGGIAWALSEVRSQLEGIADVEGVKDILDRFPECVLLGGISARRELVAALLGEHGVATAASAVLVAPGMRQPLALELRSGKQDFPNSHGPEAEAWLRSVSQAASQALGQRLKTEPLRLRMSAAGCANLDVIDLPEKCGQGDGNGSPSHPKIEEMRIRHLGSTSNILVCLEPGGPLELCRRFDPMLRRTVLIGAAASSAVGDTLPAATLCGPAAANTLEERFASLCNERVPQWLSGLERLETRLSRASNEAREAERREDAEEVLRRSRAAGLSFGRALQEVIAGSPGCRAGALTLEEELVEFAATVAKGLCGSGPSLNAKDAASAAADVFAQFEGVEGYAAYLRNEIKIPGADVPLNGGAAWQRLLAEVEVAMRLAHPPPEELADIKAAAVRAGGTGVHGHMRWEDVASKLMLTVAFEPLLRRIRYVAARLIWLLRYQKLAVSEWMSSLSVGPASRIYSPMFSQHLTVLRSSPVVRDLVFGAYDGAVAFVGEQVLKNLEGTLTAACINPDIMLRPRTNPDLDPTKPLSLVTPTPVVADNNGDTEMKGPEEPTAASGKSGTSGRAKEARQRVAAEMTRRSGPSGGLPRHLQDRVFDPKEAAETVHFVANTLKNSFAVLADILANQAFAFADACLSTLCRRQIDEAMNNIEFSSEQKRVLGERHGELIEVARQVEDRLVSVRRCLASLRTAEAKTASQTIGLSSFR